MLLDPTFYASVGQDEQTYYAAVYVFLAVGVVMFLVGIIGCCGAFRESPCMLVLFCCFLMVVIVAEIVAVVWVYNNRARIEHYVRDNVKSTVQQHYGVVDSSTKAFDSIQQGLQCCGANGPKDWAGSRYNMRDRGAFDLAVTSLIQVYKIPPSCCRVGVNEEVCKAALNVGIGAQILNVIYSDGCIDKVIEALKNHMNILLGIGIGIGVIECLGLVFSLIRCCGIRNMDKA
ncbi:CD9 antigen-like isoform X2 [Periplaneta americana]